ncbi:uncharacterized protein LOC112085445 [Eutrema salsugineum]|uniref:uncharacterized protein LOC112085445 n=1 Tax=Eutrema salsugineum TaxID=72664 RepID=UPI000CED2F85|nr:uncharacterized protein LOC112085445 [Eutrema salsugineum]
MSKVIADAREWQSAQTQIPKRSLLAGDACRPPPRSELIRVFTDGAWNEETSITGLGWVFLQPNGEEITSGQAAEGSVSSPLVAKALVIRSALDHGLSLGISAMIINSDAQLLTRAINSQAKIKEIYGYLFDINALASLFSSISFIFISRSAKAALRELPPISLYSL